MAENNNLMRYLLMEQLMKDLEFLPEDQEYLAGQRLLLKKSASEEAFLALVRDFTESLPDDLSAVETALSGLAADTAIHPYTMNLLFLLECALPLREAYARSGYTDQLFLDTMRDLKWKTAECRDVYGVAGNFVMFWYPGFYQLKRFALGRLQYELYSFPCHSGIISGVTIRKGSPVINLHIPSCGLFTKELWEDSIHRAMDFFSDAFPDGIFPFFIESWIVDPDLVRLLPEGNLKDFSELFTLLDVRKFPDFPDGWRIFGKDWKLDPKDLPRNTRLQKNVADFLARGGKIGEGFGAFILRRK